MRLVVRGQVLARPAEWLGECEAELGGRKYYPAARLANTQQVISAGSFVALNPSPRTKWLTMSGADIKRSVWIAVVKQLFLLTCSLTTY